LCLENEEGLYGESPESCRELCDHFGGRLKSVFDMGNFLLCGYNPKKAYKILKDYIEYFHIKDALKDGSIVPCGEGKAKIKQILKKFKKESKKESVFVSLEPHLVDFVGLNDLAMHNLKKKVSFANDAEAFTYASKNLDGIIKSI
jgi:sugar phosphate isomerase/epimerase